MVIQVTSSQQRPPSPSWHKVPYYLSHFLHPLHARSGQVLPQQHFTATKPDVTNRSFILTTNLNSPRGEGRAGRADVPGGGGATGRGLRPHCCTVTNPSTGVQIPENVAGWFWRGAPLPPPLLQLSAGRLPAPGRTVGPPAGRPQPTPAASGPSAGVQVDHRRTAKLRRYPLSTTKMTILGFFSTSINQHYCVKH